jgi:hypothetical protein
MSPTPVNEGTTDTTPGDHMPLRQGLSPVVVFVPGLGLDSRSCSWSAKN